MKILMVCAGNICRSPLAEGIMQHYIAQNSLNWHVDSAGTERYHVGQQPDERSIETAQTHGIDISQQRARQFSANDLDNFDIIYVMDTHNYNELMRHWVEANPKYNKKSYRDKIKFILNEVHPNQNRIVPDPYYGGISGFEKVYTLLDEACKVIAEKYR
jgi:protein-tyrosine phosphatase